MSAPPRASTSSCMSAVSAVTVTSSAKESLRQPLALFTSTVTGPSVDSTSSNTRAGVDGSRRSASMRSAPTSATSARARWYSSGRSRSVPAKRRYVTATTKPSRVSAAAVAAPMPWLPPVTRATRSGSLQRPHDLAPALRVGLVRGVERDAAHDVAVALRQLRADLLRLADDGEGVEDLVVDERAHLLPLAFLGQPVEVVLQVAPAVVLEHAAVRGRGAVERDLLAGAGCRLRHLLLGGAGDDERGTGDLEVAHRAARLGKAALERGDRHRPQVRLGREAVAQEAVAHLAGDLGHELADTGEVDLRV